MEMLGVLVLLLGVDVCLAHREDRLANTVPQDNKTNNSIQSEPRSKQLEKPTTTQSIGNINRDVMLRKILNVVMDYMRNGTKRKEWEFEVTTMFPSTAETPQATATTPPATTTIFTKLKSHDKVDESYIEIIRKDVLKLKEEAIDIADRASMLYLKLKKIKLP